MNFSDRNRGQGYICTDTACLVYDGSFPGLLSLFYHAYKKLKNHPIRSLSVQQDFFEYLPEAGNHFIPTDTEAARKVWSYLERNWGYEIPQSFYTVYLAAAADKDDVLARCLLLLIQSGRAILDSVEPAPCRFRELLQAVSSESHLWKGLLRFEEIQGGWLYAAMEPKHDVLSLLASHFSRRFNTENFLIHDLQRARLACHARGAAIQYVSVRELELKKTESEAVYASAWRCFYRAVKIRERENLKLMQSNMPRRYWKQLTERR